MKCTICTSEKAELYVHKNGCDVLECASCGFRFVHPLPDAVEVYDEHYFSGAQGGFGYTDYDRDKEPMRPVFEEYLQRIKQYAPQSTTLCDVGAATGFFLDIARSKGFAVSGVEISDFAAAVARQKGIPVETGTLESYSDKKIVDVMTLLDVIEHVPDPRLELIRTRAKLTKDGLLVLNTPDAGSLYARILGRKWHLIVPPEHLSYFTREHMHRLLKETGFEVVEMTTIGKTFTLPYIFKTLYAWQKLSVWKWCERICEKTILRKISLPVNVRDNMFVIARAV